MLDHIAHEANIAEQTEHNIQGGGLSYDYFSPNRENRVNAYFSFQSTARKSYYGGIGEGTPDDIEAAQKAYAPHMASPIFSAHNICILSTNLYLCHQT